MNELVSIVVPVYNVSQYLRKSLESILNQTYRNLDIIIVDDGSTDESFEICQAYALIDKRINLIHQENKGLCGARNTGIDHAKGKYITFVDSDDYVENDYIEYLLNQLLENRAEIASCEAYVLRNSKNTYFIKESGIKIISSKEAIDRLLYDDDVHTNVWAKLFLTELFEGVRFPEGMFFEESAVIHKLIFKCFFYSIGYSQKYYYNIRENSITTQKFTEKKLDLLVTTDQMCADIQEKYPEMVLGTMRRKTWATFSTLNQLYNSFCIDDEIEKRLLKRVKEYRYNVLFDKRAPLRDKVAIITLLFGRNTYRFVWNIYSKYRKRE